jgi:DNA invertase Pin-like site-specific DNA recombinase
MQRKRQEQTALRFAVYTRVNVGASLGPLRQQRKAISGFLKSRRSHGWIRLRSTYEDLGYSAGNLDRPALQTLLADIDAGQVGCVVVYDLACLTRSESDQAELFARFRRAGVAVVTVNPEEVYDFGSKTENAEIEN